MRTFQLLLILLLFLLLGAVAEGKNYSCQDGQGQLHFADSLESLPEECREQAQLLDSGAVDNLNYVPAPAESSGSDIRFEHSVRDVERELQQKQQLSTQLQERAERLADKYVAAQAEKRRAKRNWSYSSRETIQQSDKLLAHVREGKQQLLQELAAARLSSQEEQQIRAVLEPITEE